MIFRRFKLLKEKGKRKEKGKGKGTMTSALRMMTSALEMTSA
jgi:hypothetical protein